MRKNKPKAKVKRVDTDARNIDYGKTSAGDPKFLLDTDTAQVTRGETASDPGTVKRRA